MKAFASSFAIFAFGLALLGLLTGTATHAFGQAEAGTISGTVRDSSGAVLTGAKVTATNVSTSASRTAQTGDFGQYSIPGLPPGAYDLTIASSNFQTFKARTEVTVGGLTTVDAQMTVGSSSTVVEVSAANAAVEVNTQTQEISQLIDSQEISQLPSLTRNAYDFVAISGNVSGGDSTTPNAMGAQNLTGRGTGFSINGQRMSGTEILLDGQENVDVFGANIGQQIPIDTVQEYRVITNNFDSEYGRASGGVVNLTTKPGTNSVHATAWEFNRTAWSTANTYANDAHNNACLADGTCTPSTLPDPKGGYTRNQFGFQIGGPFIRNKLFASLGTEWTRVRSNSLQSQELLDPAFIAMMPANVQSYFTAFGTGAPAASSTVSAATLLAAGVPMGPVNGTTPIPGTTPVFDVVSFRVPFDAGGGLPQNTYTLAGRLDYSMTDRTQMFARVARDYEFDFLGTATPYSAYSQYDVGTSTYDDSYLYSLTHSFSVNVLSNTKLGFSRFNVFNNYNKALTSVPNLMLAGFPVDPTTGLPIQFPGLFNVAPGLGGLPFGGPQNTVQLQQDLSWTKGKHAMRFGGQFTYIQLNKAYGAYAQAVEQLGAGVSQGMGSLENITGNPGGSPLISFVGRGDPGVFPCHTDPEGNLIVTPSCTVTPPLAPADYSRSYRYNDWAIYAQDSFRATTKLTLNYGVRYEHYGVQHNVNPNLDSNFYFGSGSGLYNQVRNGQMFIADKSPVGQFWAPSWGTVSPRVGFAYDIFGDGKTSLRGGFGISYERNFGNVTFNASFNPPGSAVLNSICVPNADGTVGGPASPCPVLVNNTSLGPFGQPGPATGLPPAELRAPQSNIRTAQTQFWSLDVQRQVAKNTVLDIGYNAAHGVHLYDIENINLLGAGNFYLGDNTTNPGCSALGTIPTLCYTRPNNQFSNINMRGSLGTSSYNALNVRLQTQNLHNTGLGLVANYTWSHSLDDLSSTFSDNLQGGSGAIGNLGYTTVVDPKLDWGNSDFDIRNRFVVSPVWQTPWFKSGTGLRSQALGGWMVTGIFTARSGLPFSVFDYTGDLNFYTVPRLTPASSITNYKTGSATAVAPNLFNVLSIPVPATTGPLDPTLGISDFGPYPAGMTHRNAFRGPGAWNTDLAVSKTFKVTERVGLELRAEGFDLLNHHNMYVNTSNLAYGFSSPLQGPGATMATGGNSVTAEKGGLGSTATGGNHDERRFGQFALRVSF
jgi:Carboxypeptidase regulatory-like domain